MFSSGNDASGPVSLLLVEAVVTLIAVVLAFRWPRGAGKMFAVIEQGFARLAQRRWRSVLLVGCSAVLIRLAMLPLISIPQPFVHDEFSYLLAADTFASGRLTNPTHRLWIFFESFHITLTPTYMSMYFPAQGLVLAAGRVWFGHPWFGVLLSSGLMCAALCWMLQAWLPPRWALLGGAVAVLRLALFSYWGNSYYGGAVAAMGGALVLGALPRILRRPSAGHTLAMAMGAIMLANSRPYEGLLVCGPAFLYLVWRARRRGIRLMRTLVLPAVVLPGVLLLTAAVLMGYYNRRVFGNAFTLPYQLNRAQYAMAPVFLWQTPRPAPDYRHKVMRDFYAVWELGDFQYARTVSGFASKTAQKLATVVFFFCGFALLLPLVALPGLLRDRRLRYLILAACVYAVGLSANAWLFPHYAAPFAAGMYAFLMQGLRRVRLWRPGGQPIGLALVRNTLVVCVVLAGLRLSAGPLSLAIPRWPNMWYGTAPLGLPHAAVVAELERYGGPQLAIVRYAPDHPPFDDWVYNAADIDRSGLVWARDLGPRNCELIQYFRDRRVWLIEPDFSPPKISPYRECMDEPKPLVQAARKLLHAAGSGARL